MGFRVVSAAVSRVRGRRQWGPVRVMLLGFGFAMRSYADPSGLLSLLFGECEDKLAVLENRLSPVSINLFGQLYSAAEVSVTHLLLEVAAFPGLLVLSVLGVDHEEAVGNMHIQVLRLDARERCLDDNTCVRLYYIQTRFGVFFPEWVGQEGLINGAIGPGNPRPGWLPAH